MGEEAFDWLHVQHKRRCFRTGVTHTCKCGELKPAITVGFEYAVSVGISIGIIEDWVAAEFSSQYSQSVQGSLPECDLQSCSGTEETIREFEACFEWDEYTIDAHWSWFENTICLPDPLLGSRCYTISVPVYVSGSRFTTNRTFTFNTPIKSKSGTPCDCGDCGSKTVK